MTTGGKTHRSHNVSQATYLSGTGQPISGLSDADVQAQLPDVQVTHHILRLVGLDLGAIGLLSGLKGNERNRN